MILDLLTSFLTFYLRFWTWPIWIIFRILLNVIYTLFGSCNEENQLKPRTRTKCLSGDCPRTVRYDSLDSRRRHTSLPTLKRTDNGRCLHVLQLTNSAPASYSGSRLSLHGEIVDQTKRVRIQLSRSFKDKYFDEEKIRQKAILERRRHKSDELKERRKQELIESPM